MLASVLGFPVCGTILHLLDWRAVFYITGIVYSIFLFFSNRLYEDQTKKILVIGGISVVWSIIWFSLVSTPQKDKFMSAKERRFILAANKFTSTQKVRKSILSFCCNVHLSILRCLLSYSCFKGGLSMERNFQVQSCVGILEYSICGGLVHNFLDIFFSSVYQRYKTGYSQFLSVFKWM